MNPFARWMWNGHGLMSGIVGLFVGKMLLILLFSIHEALPRRWNFEKWILPIGVWLQGLIVYVGIYSTVKLANAY